MNKSLCYVALLALLTSACSEPAPKEETAVDAAQVQTEAPQATPVGDTSQNALDWVGIYEGVLPCASCEGIKTLITLQSDNNFIQESVYLGKDEQIFKVTGKATWDDQGKKITLEDGTQYLVGENQLIMLDTEGKQISGELASHYVLKKQSK
jgi:uncharacterized lipoprotein NlpE involved in copper resistance